MTWYERLGWYRGEALLNIGCGVFLLALVAGAIYFLVHLFR